jgi:hypothetical protein
MKSNRATFLNNRYLACVGLLLIAFIFAGCNQDATPPTAMSSAPTLSANQVDILHIVTGQTVFIPAYSEVFYGVESRLISLTTTLAIHNTDLEHPIIIRSVRYFNTDGELVREFIDNPLELNPMATTGFVIEAQDTSGGWGANFLVEWGAETSVYEPVIEAIMVSNRGTEGISFISEGRVVSEQIP